MTVEQQMKDALRKKLEEYRGGDYLLSAVIQDMRQVIRDWMPNTWTYDGQTLLIIQVLCDAGVTIA